MCIIGGPGMGITSSELLIRGSVARLKGEAPERPSTSHEMTAHSKRRTDSAVVKAKRKSAARSRCALDPVC